MVINAEQQRALLNQTGLEMLTLCISQIEKATEAFLTHDTDLAEEVINTETRVNALDLKIENDCEKFLALYNPVAIDLRFIMAILKINFDLERIADHAYGISKYIKKVLWFICSPTMYNPPPFGKILFAPVGSIRTR